MTERCFERRLTARQRRTDKAIVDLTVESDIPLSGKLAESLDSQARLRLA